MRTRVGQQLGNYHLHSCLGQGAFADVYLAEHIQLNKKVAVKVLQRRVVGTELTLFRNEARTVAQLKHHHIVQVFDFDVYEECPYLVMEYAPGGSLRQRHPRGRQLMPTEILPYVHQVAQALHYAHLQRLIHRDVKPENILLGAKDEVLLSDFGLVQLAQNTSSQSTQEMAGTILYMAPEQIRGKPRPASDQYALGVIVYEWLTGKPPFQGTLTEIATQHLLTAPPPLQAANTRISPAVEKVVLKALAKEPQERFAEEITFAEELEKAVLSTYSSFALQKERQQQEASEEFRSTWVKTPQPEELGGLMTQAPASQIQRRNETVWQSQEAWQEDVFENPPYASLSLPNSRDDLSPLVLSEQGNAQEKEEEEQWMNLRWLIFSSAIVAPLVLGAGLFLHQPPIMMASLIPAIACLILGLIQTVHYEQWI